MLIATNVRLKVQQGAVESNMQRLGGSVHKHFCFGSEFQTHDFQI